MPGKSALVTGGTVRLGRLIAERLRADGWRVYTTSSRADAEADFVADLSRPAGADELWRHVLDATGGVAPNALVNNAALFRGAEDLLWRLDYLSPRRLGECFAEAAPPDAALVNILDARLLAPDPKGPAAYLRAKRALLEATRADAVRFAGRVRVNGVAPGSVLVSDAVGEKAAIGPFGRPTPAHVAEAVAFLLGASFTTGVILPVA